MPEGRPEGLGRSRPQLNVPVERLRPDPLNPRLSPKQQNKTEQETLQIMLKEFNLLELGLSMVRNGYFDAEPLVVIPQNLPEEFKELDYRELNGNDSYNNFINNESTNFIVVEGNRRISTVKLLLAGTTSRLPEITRQDVRDDLSVLPCIVYPKRSDVLAYIGARHIIGIKKWNSFAKARYIAHLKEDLGKSMTEIQNTLGDTTQSVRKVYAAYRLVKHVEEVILNYEIRDTGSISGISDYVEFKIAYSQDTVSREEIISDVGHFSGSDVDEGFVTSVWRELELRISLYGDDPPYQIDEDGLIVPLKNWKTECPYYMACLIFSLEGNPSSEAGSTTSSGKLFERISNVSVRNYINGDSVVFGHPSSNDINSISVLMNQVYRNFPINANDRGVDIFGWKEADSRQNKVVVLVNCAAGHNWKSKTNELNLDAWKNYINFTPHSVFKGMAIPKIITDNVELDEITLDTGILFDRTRIYKFFEDNEASFRAELLEWCENRIQEIIQPV